MPQATETAEISSASQRCAVITGGTGGIGFEAARALAGAGFMLVLAARRPDRGEAAMRAIRAEHPGAQVCHERLDTADLASVRDFCHRLESRWPRLDLLVNCAGLARFRDNVQSVDGYDLQFAANHLGHFALTGLVLPLLRKSPGARIIGVSSIAHFLASNDYESLRGNGRYWPFGAYCRSKLAVLVWAKELQRRFARHGCTPKSIPVHPGLVRTSLFATEPGTHPLLARFLAGCAQIVGQPAAMGALPLIYAATDESAVGGVYYGPGGLCGLRGKPAPARCSRQAKDEQAARDLWSLSERLTGVVYRFE